MVKKQKTKGGPTADENEQGIRNRVQTQMVYLAIQVAIQSAEPVPII